MRFRYRHVHATMHKAVKAQLRDLHWGDSSLPSSDVINTGLVFETTSVTYLDFQPDEAGKTIVENTVAITLGEEPSAKGEELGDGLRSVSYPVFIDIYGANAGVAQSIASDVRDYLEDLYLPVLDFTGSPPAATQLMIESLFDDVTVEIPAVALGITDLRRHWRVVKTLATVYYVP